MFSLHQARIVFLIGGVLAGLITACHPLSETGTSNPAVLTSAAGTVQVIRLTERPTASLPPSTVVPTQIVTSTRFPTPTRTVTPPPISFHIISPTPSPTQLEADNIHPSATQKLPFAEVRILKPGALSKVTSPVQVEISANPGPGGHVQIELVDEDGIAITRQVKDYAGSQSQRVGITIKLEFEIPSVSKLARLQVFELDSYSRVKALSSVDLILLSVGDSQINISGDMLSPYAISQPRSNQIVQGGKLSISGLVRPVSDRPLIFELLDNQGKSLASRQLPVTDYLDGAFWPVNVDLSYSIQSASWELLVVHQFGTRIPGDAAVASVPIYLKP